MTQHRTPEDVAAAYDRGVDEGIDMTIEIVRRHLTAQQRHAVDRDIAAWLAHESMAGARRLVHARTADHPSKGTT